MEFFYNKHWNNNHPFVSILTAVYNRKILLARAFKSVEAQVYRNFEYIIVNDGSTENLDDTVFSFMEKVDFPVLYIKKPNGGVHTARNAAIKYCRGTMALSLDSDDELVPETLQVLVETWNSIPLDKRSEYREVCSACMDQNKNRVSELLPNNINDLSWKKARRIASKAKGERFGFWRVDTLREFPWPEPKGVTFVEEGVVWNELSKKYKTYFINDLLRIYHIDNNDSYTRTKTLTEQTLKNLLWNKCHLINKRGSYHNLNDLLKDYIIYKALLIVVKRRKINIEAKIKRKNIFVRLLLALCTLPGYILSLRYN